MHRKAHEPAVDTGVVTRLGFVARASDRRVLTGAAALARIPFYLPRATFGKGLATHNKQQVGEMANEVLTRQAQAHAYQTGEKHSKTHLRAYSRPRPVGSLESFAMGHTGAR